MHEIIMLILMFFTYSFIGWLMEVLLSFYQYHHFVNRGFLLGPYCPIYGVGCIILYLGLGQYADDPLVLFIMTIVMCSILEYVTSYVLEKIFKNRWWDYSKMKFNINGRICLECAIPFGVGGIIVFYGINPPIVRLLHSCPLQISMTLALTLIFIFLIDLAVSFNVILNLKNISNNIRSDSTELITKKVREIMTEKNFFYRRIIKSFPDMKIQNRLAILKQKLDRDTKEYKKEKKRRS